MQEIMWTIKQAFKLPQDEAQVSEKGVRPHGNRCNGMLRGKVRWQGDSLKSNKKSSWFTCFPFSNIPHTVTLLTQTAKPSRPSPCSDVLSLSTLQPSLFSSHTRLPGVLSLLCTGTSLSEFALSVSSPGMGFLQPLSHYFHFMSHASSCQNGLPWSPYLKSHPTICHLLC